MKQILVLCAMVLVGLTARSQYYSPDFLDGTIVFKMAVDPVQHHEIQKDRNSFSLQLNPSDYPEIQSVFQNVTITSLEKPSYFAFKKETANIFRVKFAEVNQIDQLVAALSRVPGVEFAEKMPIYKIDFVPNDTYHTGNNKWYHTLVGSEAAWDISQGSNSVKVAIVDNAVFCGHNDLTTFAQWDVADNDNNAAPPSYYNADQGWSHGTHCAGLATADINNATGIASLGANVEVIGVKCTPNTATSGSVWYSYEGVQWACQNGARVVSMSFGGATASAAFQSLINAYPDIVFIAAAGNDGATALMYPGAYNNVICVGSVDANDQRSSFSNYNGTTPFVDIASPGGFSYGGLYSTVYTANSNGYGQMGGTSMATPFAAGLVGNMLSINPALTPTQVLNCLTSTGVNINQAIGPRINAPAALNCVQSTVTGQPIPYFTGAPTTITEGSSVTYTDLSNGGGSTITSWSWSFPGGNPATFNGQTPPAITYATAGVYNASLTVTNANGSQTYTRTNYINVSVPPYGEWIVQNSGFTTANRGISHISIVDQNVVWATAYDGSGNNANVQQFTKTTDGGLTWTPGNININNTGLGISMIHAQSATKAWLAAYPNGIGQTGGIWITNDGGTTWTRQNTATYNNSASFTNAVYFWNDNEGLAMGDPINNDFEIYRTTNGGTNWTLVAGANIPNAQASEYGYVHNMEVVGDNVWFGTSTGRIFYSSNRGATWQVFTSPVTDFGGTTMSANMSFTSPTEGIIINNAGSIWRTTNSGSTWTSVTPTGPVYTSGLCYIEGTQTVFSTGAASGSAGSSYSEDGGVTWTLIDAQQHLYVDFINPSIGWSGWFNTSATQNGMWKWNDLSSNLQGAFSTAATNVCVNTPIPFTDNTSGGTPTSWQWQFPGGTPATSTQQNPSVTYATPGIYTVTLTVGDGSSQTTVTNTDYLTVVSPAATPASITGPAAVCPNTTEVYSVTLDTNVFYNWSMPGTWTGSSFTNTISVNFDATPGTLTLITENACGQSAPVTIDITILGGLPVAGFTNVINVGSVDFTSTSTNSTAWSWDFGDGATATTENATHVYTANGTYTVTLIATSPCGADTISQQVTIAGLGLENLATFNGKIYPVPSSKMVTIEVSLDHLNASFEIVDQLGKVVHQGTFKNESTDLNIESWSKGVYFLKSEGVYLGRMVRQ